MKKIAIIMLVFMLTGCCSVYQADKRPQFNDAEVWVCENPKSEFYWSKVNGCNGKIKFLDKEWNIIQEEQRSSTMIIFENTVSDKVSQPQAETDGIQQNVSYELDNVLLRCRAYYGLDKLTLVVEEDYKNVFHGFYPILHFEKRNKAEYLKKIGEEQ